MIVTLHNGNHVRVAFLIPSRGRAASLGRSLRRKMAWLADDIDLHIGVELPEGDEYRQATKGLGTNLVHYPPMGGSIGKAREFLRAYAVDSKASYDYFISTDDNAKFTKESAVALVRCCAEFPTQPAIAVGYHKALQYFDREKTLHDRRTINGVRSFENIGTIYTCIPRAVYEQYTYPADCPAVEDRHFVLWCLSRGITTWRVCEDALFEKRRYEAGGSGSVEERQVKCGLGMARLCLDFPQFMGIGGVYRAPWKQLLKLARGQNFSKRPLLGSARKEHVVLAEMTARKRRVPVVRRTPQTKG